MCAGWLLRLDRFPDSKMLNTYCKASSSIPPPALDSSVCTGLPNAMAHEACPLYTLLRGLQSPSDSPEEAESALVCRRKCAELFGKEPCGHTRSPPTGSHILGQTLLPYVPGLNDLSDSSVHFWLCQLSGLSFFHRLLDLWEDSLFPIPTLTSQSAPTGSPLNLGGFSIGSIR